MTSLSLGMLLICLRKRWLPEVDTRGIFPHHGVINPNKSKVHIVYDAAVE